MFNFFRFFLFLFPAEKAHYLALDILKTFIKIPFLPRLFFPISKNNPLELCGLRFKNKIGLAAGFDKNAKYLEVMKFLNFGHVEIGTVTPKPQYGNDKPRLFRLVKDEAIINRLGFNNDGVDAIVERLKNRPTDLIIGGNIGKNKITPNEKAVDDYKICFEKLYPFVDYFTINVSSPNTPGLRELQEKGPLLDIINSLSKLRNNFVANQEIRKPIFLKIAPDLSQSQLDDIVEIVNLSELDAIVSSNTTLNRENLKTDKSFVEKIGAGGLSGKPIFDYANLTLDYLNKKLNNKIPIIAVGGINSIEDANKKLKLGAEMVQIYSGFIYKGPKLVKEIAELELN